jgi:hypothetical protein
MATPANAKYKKEQRKYRERVQSSVIYPTNPDQVIQTRDGRLYRQGLNGVLRCELRYPQPSNLPAWAKDPIGAARVRAQNFLQGLSSAKGQRVIIHKSEALQNNRAYKRELSRFKRLQIKALFHYENILRTHLSNALRYSRVLHGEENLNRIRWAFSVHLANAEQIRKRAMERKGIKVSA